MSQSPLMTNEDQVPDIMVKPSVFSKRIDSLILKIWELGGKADLYANIDRLRVLPEDEFESQLLLMMDKFQSDNDKSE